MIKVLKNDPVFKQPFIGLAKSKKRDLRVRRRRDVRRDESRAECASSILVEI